MYNEKCIKFCTNGQKMYMKKISTKNALKIAYENLYSSNVKNINRNLDNLLKAKKIASIENGLKSKQNKEELER